VNKIIKKIWPFFIPIGLAIITFLTYLPSFYYAFQFDDEPSILNFYAIRHKTLSNLFFTSTRWVSYWLNTIHYKLGQFDPFIYRRTNVIVHCLTGILLFIFLALVLRLRSKKSFIHKYAYVIAGITSGLFLLHPVQTQTVSYVIQGQLEGLSAFFCLAIIVSFILFATTRHLINKILLIIGIAILCIIGAGTKEITIILPFLIPLVDWFFIAQGNWQSFKKRLWLHSLIAGIIWGCYLWLLGKNFFLIVLSLKIEHQNTIGNIINPTGEKITAWPFFISQFKVILHYLFMFIWPFNICVDYDWKICSGFDSLDCILPFFALLTILGTVFFALKNNRISLYAFGMLWFFICTAPRSTIMPSTELMADYKVYLASIGWLFVLSLALIYLYRFIAKKYSILNQKSIIILTLIITTAILSFLTYQRNKVWKSGLAFWHDITCKSPTKARGYNNYGVNLFKINDIKNAIWYFKRAIQLEPFTYPDPYNNLSAAYAVQNKYDLATKALRASLKINPTQPKSYNNLGLYLIQKNEYEWAEKSFQQAISLYPHYGKAYHNLGRLYATQNRQEEAWKCFKKACTEADYDTHEGGIKVYAQTSIGLKMYSDAIHAYKMLLNLKSNDSEAMINLAYAYLMNKNYHEAIELYQQLKPHHPEDARITCNLTECWILIKQPKEALALIEELEHQSKTYPSMAIHKARALHMLGKSTQAQLALYNFINHTSDLPMKKLAQQVLQQIENEENKDMI